MEDVDETWNLLLVLTMSADLNLVSRTDSNYFDLDAAGVAFCQSSKALCVFHHQGQSPWLGAPARDHVYENFDIHRIVADFPVGMGTKQRVIMWWETRESNLIVEGNCRLGVSGSLPPSQALKLDAASTCQPLTPQMGERKGFIVDTQAQAECAVVPTQKNYQHKTTTRNKWISETDVLCINSVEVRRRFHLSAAHHPPPPPLDQTGERKDFVGGTQASGPGKMCGCTDAKFKL